MPSWWRKPSSKDVKRKTNGGSLIGAIHRKLHNVSGGKNIGSESYSTDTASEKELGLPRSESPSLLASRCQSFKRQTHVHPLPLPELQLSSVEVDDSGVSTSRLESHECSTPFPVSLLLKDNEPFSPDALGDLATGLVSSNSSMDLDDQHESQPLSLQAPDNENGNVTSFHTPSMKHKDQSPFVTQRILKDLPSDNHIPLPSRERALSTKMTILHIPCADFVSAPVSSISTPSWSPLRACSEEQGIGLGFSPVKQYLDVSLVGCGQCSSPDSGHNSGDMPFFLPQSRCSPESSPIRSPGMTSPGSWRHSGTVSPLHPWAEGSATELSMGRPDDRKALCHRLPRPPQTIPSSCSFPTSYLTVISPTPPRNSSQAESLTSPVSCWKKGRLIGSGTYGQVYLGFNSESGELCAMKEVTLFLDDSKSNESVQQLEQEINLLSCLRHPNIVRYFGSEMVDDKLYIYLEYISGGSIHKLLQEYGQLGESVIRSYTQQILSGLACLHAKNTAHRDIKGANILVDPTGRVKLADFGMAKHITGLPCPLSFKGSPYWMAPEVIRNSKGCNLAVDIWSLGCTVIEMATARPPWSQYEGVAALFKVGYSKELPTIPDHLSEEGKDFVRQCLQRNPRDRPTALQLLQHPFVRNVAPPKRSSISSELLEPVQIVSDAASYMDIGHQKKFSCLKTKGVDQELSKGFKIGSTSSDARIPRHLSCPVSPIGSPLRHQKSSQTTLNRMRSPSTISSPHMASASSTPNTGGTAALPMHHFLNSTAPNVYECSPLQRPQNGLYTNGSALGCKPRLEPETSSGVREIAHMTTGTVSSRNNFNRKSVCASLFKGAQERSMINII